MKFSDQQTNAFNEAIAHNSICLEAGPGCGKSTTLIEMAKQLTGNILAVVFNNTTAYHLEKMMPKNVVVVTAHKLGNAFVKNYPTGKREWNKVLHDRKDGNLDKKFFVTMYNTVKDSTADRTEQFNTMDYLYDVCHKLRMTLTDYTNEAAVEETLSHFNLPLQRYDLIKVAMEELNKAFIKKNWVDFTDMLYLPNFFNMPTTGVTIGKSSMPVTSFDYILIDEAQDFSMAMIKLIQKIVTKKTTVIAVGDRNQSINGFAGAMVDSLDQMIAAFNLKPMPLTITYRCPKVVVDLINTTFGTELICGNNRVGEIKRIDPMDIPSYCMPGDLVISRVQKGKQALLIPVMQKVIENGVPCRLLGLNLLGIINKRLEGVFTDTTIVNNATYESVIQYAEVAREKLLKKKWHQEVIDNAIDEIMLIASLVDFYINYIKTGVQYWENFCDWIDSLENVKGEAVTFSTIHKAKGAEANNVFIIEIEQKKKELKDWEKIMESNIQYVAYSRPIETLYLA